MDDPKEELKHYIPSELLEKILSNSKIEGECLIWTGTLDQKKGYGKISFDSQSIGIHRFVGKFLFGVLTDGDEICHRCGNKACFRPSHLYKGNRSTNAMDAYLEGKLHPDNGNSHKFQCINGHNFDEENTGRYNNGRRYCKKCKRTNAIMRNKKQNELIREALLGGKK